MHELLWIDRGKTGRGKTVASPGVAGKLTTFVILTSTDKDKFVLVLRALLKEWGVGAFILKATSLFKGSKHLITSARRTQGETLASILCFVGPPGQLVSHFMKKNAELNWPLV